MDFDITFQRAVLRLMLADESFAQRCLQHLHPGFFASQALGWIFKFYQSYWLDYSIKLTDIVLRNELRRLPAEQLQAYAGEVEYALQGGPVLEADYLKHELSNFIRMNIFAEAHKESRELFNASERDKAYEVMAAAQDKIQSVTFDAPKRQFFFEELGQRQLRRAQDQIDFDHVPRMTGISDLDQITNGGVQDGELWCVLAYPKRCKTTWLLNQGFHSTRVHGQPTLHIQLEGKDSQIADKYDACFSRELYTRVKQGSITTALYRDLQSEYQRLRSLLVIRTLNDWDVNITHIIAELDELRTQHGFEPRTLIVDYMDLLRSRHTRVDSELQHQLDGARDLKRLVNVKGFGCWSAWQAQRPRAGLHEKQHVLTSSSVADCYAKARIVDSYGSLNATNQEMRDGIMRVYWEDHRDAPVGKMYRIQNDLSTMRMIETSEEVTSDDVAMGAQ